VSDVVLECLGVQKNYGALRPLRLKSLSVASGAAVALAGLDAAAAEILVNLITGASLPDEGTVRVFGQLTSAIDDSEAWLKGLDRFGIVSDRAVLLDELTVGQNLAMTFTLDIDPIEASTRDRIQAVAAGAGLDVRTLEGRTSSLDDLGRARLRLARATALDPALLVAEHPTASLRENSTRPFADDLRRVIERRALTAVIVTADTAFASRVTRNVFDVRPADGSLVKAATGWRGRLLGR
jgi:predicted ABC-type transport system involved in lysophospholipase L1 biosynthesis ATPase subunit